MFVKLKGSDFFHFGMLIHFVLCLMILKPDTAFAQNNMRFKAMVLSVAAEDDANAGLYQNSINEGNTVLFTPGVQLAYEGFVREDVVSLVLVQGVYKDAAQKMAGYTQFHVHLLLVAKRLWSLNVGLGPSVFYRQTWADLPNFRAGDRFKIGNGRSQMHLSFLSGSAEANFKLNKGSDLSVSINHNHPMGLTLACGLRFWMSKKVKRRACDCPSFH